MHATPPGDHGGPITIGLRDLYVQLQSLERTMSGLGAKMDMLAQAQQLSQQSFAQQVADVRADLTDHELRLRNIESRNVVTPRSMWTGIGVIIPVFGIIIAIISLIVG